MSNINIFVAGAKELKQERTCIKALANELSSKYQSRGIHLIAQSYEHFKDDQQVYNAFIVNEADIAIFIIDEGIGPKTQDEFFKATDSLSRDNHPEVIVFIRKHDQDTPSIKEAKDIVSARLGDKYYVEYKDLEDLKQKVKERLDKSALEKSYTIGRMKLGVFRALFFMALLVIVGGVVFWIINKQPRQSDSEPPKSVVNPENKADTSLIVFAGGGSVRNFIEDKTGNRPSKDTIIIDEYPNSINIPLPSSSAWHILTEEAEQYERNNNHKYFTVCLSARKTDKPLISDEDRAQNAQVERVEIQIGEDENTVYISKNLYNKLKQHEDLKGIKENTITCKQLISLIGKIESKEIEASIYTTTENSGTLHSYFEAIKEDPETIKDTALIHQYHVFYDHSKRRKITGENYEKDYVLLGSRYYTIGPLRNNTNCIPLVLKNSKGIIIRKPVYIYFLAFDRGVYRDNHNVFDIGNRGDKGQGKGEPILTFLQRLDLELIQDEKDRVLKNKEYEAWKRLMSSGELLDDDPISFKARIKGSIN